MASLTIAFSDATSPRKTQSMKCVRLSTASNIGSKTGEEKQPLMKNLMAWLQLQIVSLLEIQKNGRDFKGQFFRSSRLISFAGRWWRIRRSRVGHKISSLFIATYGMLQRFFRIRIVANAWAYIGFQGDNSTPVGNHGNWRVALTVCMAPKRCPRSQLWRKSSSL